MTPNEIGELRTRYDDSQKAERDVPWGDVCRDVAMIIREIPESDLTKRMAMKYNFTPHIPSVCLYVCSHDLQTLLDQVTPSVEKPADEGETGLNTSVGGLAADLGLPVIPDDGGESPHE